MERQVFISYAAKDPEWTEEKVEELAKLILNAGVSVRLDVWHQRDSKRLLSPGEWRDWMADSLKQSTNVMCLVSERYRMLWDRSDASEGGFGVAFESIRLEHALYIQKQRNRGRILTVRIDGNGYDSIPHDLALDCPPYCWVTDRDILISHLCEAEHMTSGITPERLQSDVAQDVFQTVADSGTELNSELLRHQAGHAVSSLRRAPGYWAGLCRSGNLMNWLPAKCLGSPSSLVEELTRLSPEMLQRVMRELREVFKDTRAQLSDAESGDAAFATVACYLFCVCLLIKADAGDATVGLPRVDSPDAARLLASLIALVMAGGRLELRFGSGVLPEGAGTYSIQLLGENEESDFERQLYAMLVLKPWSVAAGLKTGRLSASERDELLTALEDIRGDGDRTKAMCFVVESETRPENANFALARAIRVPVFHAEEAVAYKLLGISETKLVSNLNQLWADVSSSLFPLNPQADSAQPTLSDLMRELRALAEAMNQHVASKDIQVAVDALQHASDAKQPPSRDILATTKQTLENLTQVGASGEKLVARLLQLLNFFM